MMRLGLTFLLAALWGAEFWTPDAAAAGSSPLHIVSASQWGSLAAPQAVYRSVRHTRITGLTLHHQGEIWKEGSDVSSYLRSLQQWSRRERAWVDVPYHYIIAPDGTVYEGRAIEWAGDSNTAYDTLGFLQVMLLGNFEEQRPTPAQLQVTAQLMAHLMKDHALAPESVVPHLHHTTQTVCPGANLMVEFKALVLRAASLRTGVH